MQLRIKETADGLFWIESLRVTPRWRFLFWSGGGHREWLPVKKLPFYYDNSRRDPRVPPFGPKHSGDILILRTRAEAEKVAARLVAFDQAQRAGEEPAERQHPASPVPATDPWYVGHWED